MADAIPIGQVPAIKAMIAFCAEAPEFATAEGYWDDQESACADGMRQGQSEAAELMRAALKALGVDPPKGRPTCPDCYCTDGDHSAQCQADEAEENEDDA